MRIARLLGEIPLAHPYQSGVDSQLRDDGYRFTPPILRDWIADRRWVETFCVDTHRFDCSSAQLCLIFAAMANYRRNLVPGGRFFFTVNLADRRSCLLTNEFALLRSAFRSVAQRHPFTIDAVVVLPEHLHCIWTLPTGDTDFAVRWRLIKTEFSKHIAAGESRSPSRAAKSERGIWQRRYWEHTLRDERDFEAHCDYIHFNPVKHGHAASPANWPFSSFKRFVGLGVYEADWGGSRVDDGLRCGERKIEE